MVISGRASIPLSRSAWLCSSSGRRSLRLLDSTLETSVAAEAHLDIDFDAPPALIRKNYDDEEQKWEGAHTNPLKALQKDHLFI